MTSGPAARHAQRVADLLADAGGALGDEDWDAVRDLARAVLALAPGNTEAQGLLDRVERAAPADGERRQLTVMFCDVVGSTTLSQDRDPELVREVLRTYQATCDEAVRRYDGRIARYVGDGILAYFGHPVAHEDDARRAVKAGLDLLSALRPVTEEVRARYGIDLAVRVAVHTGLVVLADMGSASTPDPGAIVGQAPNVASRLQDHAAPGSLVISQQTYELVRGWFLVAPLGRLELRGLQEPVAAYTVVEETAIESRVQAQADLSPFVGREQELAAVTAAWEEARHGGHAAVVLRGQAGVGKSRIADVLRRRVQADDGAALIANCSTYHGTTTLFPVRRLLERAAGIDTRQDAELALPRLWNVMESVGQPDSVPLLADLLEIPPTDWCPAPELEPAALHEHLLTSLVDFVRASARRAPLLLVVDDLQWADASTLELIGRLLAARVPGLLLVMTARTEVSPPWPSVTEIELDRMTRAELDELARRLPDGRRLDQAALDQAIERSDGIPFFLEELLRSSALARLDVDDRGAAIPPALRDLLLARFASPGVDLQIAQLLATIGGEATAGVAGAVCGFDPSEVEHRLQPLVDADILVRLPGAPTGYAFRHHLLADLAYDTQLRPARERAHGAVADALRSGASVGVAAAPAVVAHHLEHAGRIAEAVEALHEAADLAHGLGANAEVAALIARGLDLVAKLPIDVGRDLELHLRLLRAANVSSQLGYAAPQAVEDYAAARALVSGAELSGYLDDVHDGDLAGSTGYQWVASVTGLWAALLLQGQLDECDAINRMLCARFRPGDIAQEYSDVVGRSMTSFFRGDYARSTTLFTELVRVSAEFSLPMSSAMPSDPVSSGQAHLGFVLAVGGRFDEARAVLDAALEEAQSYPFPVGPFGVCYVLGVRASVEIICGDREAAATLAGRQRELAERHGFTFWALISSLHFSTAAYAAGDDAAGQQALMTVSLLRAVGMHVWTPSFLGAIAAVQLERGEFVAAEVSARDGLDTADRTGAHYWSAELHRLIGEARVGQGDPAGLDTIRRAIELSLRDSAHLHELWARTSICCHDPADADGAALSALLQRLDLPADAPPRLAAEAALGR